METKLIHENGAALSSKSLIVNEGVDVPIPDGFTIIDGEDGKLDIPSKFFKTLKHPDIADESPMFITVEMPSGPSRFLTIDSVLKKKTEIAHRIWPGDIIWNFAEQIRTNKLPGYSGHDGIFNMHEVPADIPFIWLSAAKAVNTENGKPVTLVRGYVRKGSPMRQFIHLEQVDSFSVFSLADSEIVDGAEFGFKDQKVAKVTKAALLSFDAVRKGTEGILGTKVISKEKAEVETEAIKIVANLTSVELKDHNPKLFGELAKTESSADLDEVTNKLQKTIREKADLAEKAVVADKLSELLSCENSEIYAIVSNIIVTQQAAIKKAIETETAKFDGRPKTQGRIKRALNSHKAEFTTAAEVSEFVAEELAIITENSRDTALKHKVGVTAGNKQRRSGDEALFSEDVQDMEGKTVFEVGSMFEDAENEEDDLENKE